MVPLQQKSMETNLSGIYAPEPRLIFIAQTAIWSIDILIGVEDAILNVLSVIPFMVRHYDNL